MINNTYVTILTQPRAIKRYKNLCFKIEIRDTEIETDATQREIIILNHSIINIYKTNIQTMCSRIE